MHLPSEGSFFRPESATIANELPEIPGFFYFCSLTSFIQKNQPWEEVTKKPQKVKDSRAHSAKAALQKQPNKRNL
jgi:hypothetical protein